MLKRLLLACLPACLWLPLTAQQSINTPSLTTVLPPAPDAWALTRYAGLPINFATGAASAGIPLVPVKEGALNLNIQLSYQGGNGVKINEIASRAGMSWLLQAGGVISRTVFDQSDEDHKWLTAPPDLYNDNTAVYKYLDSAASGLYDTQTDLFSFNFNGYSGTFFLQPTNKKAAVLTTAAPLKIELNLDHALGSSWSIRITDAQGIRYEFGGTGAIEKTRTVPAGSSCGRVYNSFIPNAWYLKTIRGIHGETITFSYAACNYDYLADVTQTRIRTPAATLVNPACPPNTCPARSEDQVCFSDLRHQGVILKTITSRYQQVRFSYSTRADLPGDSLLSAVQYYTRSVTDSTQFTASELFQLQYTYASNNSYYNANGSSFLWTRPFLQQVSRQSSGLTAQNYKMHYKQMNTLASRLSFAQDYWGYFNGKNNQHLIPTSNVPEIQQVFGTLANREPDGDYAAAGMLTRIFYPTGGSDSLEYEPNLVYETRSAPLPPATVSRSVQGTGVKDPVSVTYPFTLTVAQNVTLDMTVQYSGNGTNDGVRQHAIVEVLNAASVVVYTYLMPIGTVYTKSLLLAPGNYTLNYTAYGEATLAGINFTYQTYGPPLTQNYVTGGVRVKRNLSIPNTGELQIRRFAYHALSTPAQSSALLREKPNLSLYYAELLDGQTCTDGSVAKCSYLVGYSTGINPLFYTSGTHLYYQDVIVLQDDQGVNGGTAYHYLGSQGFNPQLIRGRAFQGVPLSNVGYPVGMEDRKYEFSLQGTFPDAYTHTLVRETRTHYKSDSRGYKEVDNYVVKQSWPNVVIYDPPAAPMFEPFDVMRYTRVGMWMYPDTVTTVTYNPDGLQPLTERQISVYNSFQHQQPNEMLYLTSEGPVKRMVISYPEEMALQGTPAPYLGLLAQHRVAIPVRTAQYSNTTFMQEVTHHYASWPNNQFEPGQISMRTGASPEQFMVNFDAYDLQGKLLTQSRPQGSKTSYKYGYRNGLVIAECKNATPASFYFENFEDDAAATSGDAHTGKWYKTGTFNVSWTIPDARSYMLRYYYLSGGKWNFKQQAYTGPQVLSDGTAIDDVAVFPADGELSTITYEPHLGMTSMTEPNGNVTYYEYDAYGRLTVIRDHQKFITRSYIYHDVFGSASSVTVYYNQQQSQAFTKICQTGTGSTITYTVPAGTFSSLLSQADANQQALAKIAREGQQYADEKGTCSTSLRRTRP